MYMYIHKTISCFKANNLLIYIFDPSLTLDEIRLAIYIGYGPDGLTAEFQIDV